MALTAAEQYLIELINRARLDPLAEAARYNLGLNTDLAAGTIDGSAKQVLAPDAQLELAADRHSQWMIDTDTFSHTGTGGSNPGARMTTAGYSFTGSYSWRENLSFWGTTGSVNLGQAIELQYDGLYRSAGHRANTFAENVREIGVAQVAGSFTSGGRAYNASLLTENFATTGTAVFVTGVAYTDTDSNAFYGIGEAKSGMWISADGTRATTGAAGGYGIAVLGDSSVAVSIGQGTTTLASLSLDLSDGNGKLDLIAAATGGWGLALSASATLISGLGRATLLGVADLNLTGTAGVNVLTGNKGNNILNDGGPGGVDTLRGAAGNDTYIVNNAGAVIIEITGGGTADRVAAGVSFTLAADDNIEQLTTRSSTGTSAINLTGNAVSQSITGNDGANALRGEGGNDVLCGRGGADRLTGGTGSDLFVFNTAGDSAYGPTTRDVITDFSRGADDVYLTAIDANSSLAGNQAFAYIGTAAFDGDGATSAGQLRWRAITGGGVIVEADLNGDGMADMQIGLLGLTLMAQTDFIL